MRHVGVELIAFLPEGPWDRAGQILGRAAAVDGAAFRGLSVGVLGQPRQHQQSVAKRLERLQDRRELEAGALRRRGPLFDDHPIGEVDDAEPLDRVRRRSSRAA